MLFLQIFSLIALNFKKTNTKQQRYQNNVTDVVLVSFIFTKKIFQIFFLGFSINDFEHIVVSWDIIKYLQNGFSECLDLLPWRKVMAMVWSKRNQQNSEYIR